MTDREDLRLENDAWYLADKLSSLHSGILSRHRCNTSEIGWAACPPSLCEADNLLARLAKLEAELADNTTWIRSCYELGIFQTPAIQGGAKSRMALNDAALDAQDETTHRGSCRIHYAESICTCGAQDETPPEPREGIVTVYDNRNRYLGCMGIATWHEMLDAQDETTLTPDEAASE